MSRKIKNNKMNKINVTSDQLHCPQCGTIIPKGHTKCPNPNCPSNKPIYSKINAKN